MEKLTKEAEESLLHQYFFNKGKEIGIRQEKERTAIKIMELSHCTEDIEYVTGLSKEELEEFLSEKLYGDIKKAIDTLTEDEVKDLMLEGETIDEFKERLKDIIQKPHYILADKEMRDRMEKCYREVYGEDYYSNNNKYDDDDKDDYEEDDEDDEDKDNKEETVNN